jgi:hypothetical protein
LHDGPEFRPLILSFRILCGGRILFETPVPVLLEHSSNTILVHTVSADDLLGLIV